MQKVILAKNIDVNKITFSAIRTGDSGAKSVFINYESQPIYAQIPKMKSLYGLSKWSGDGKVPDKYSMELSFQGYETNASLGKFMDVLKAMNDKFIDEALAKSPEWFRKKFTSPDVVEAIYTPLIKYHKDKETGEISDKYAPTFRLNIPFRDGKVTCPVYDENKELMDLTKVESKSAMVTAIVKFSGLWIAGGKFGCNCKVEQLLVVAPKVIKGFAFQDNDDDTGVAGAAGDDSDLESDIEADVDVVENDNDDEAVAKAPVVQARAVPVAPVKEEDDAGADEDDDDDDDEEEDAATPVVEPPKKVVAKKAAVVAPPPPVPKDVAVEDSDEDDDDALEKPKVVKNVARKKK